MPKKPQSMLDLFVICGYPHLKRSLNFLHFYMLNSFQRKIFWIFLCFLQIFRFCSKLSVAAALVIKYPAPFSVVCILSFFRGLLLRTSMIWKAENSRQTQMFLGRQFFPYSITNRIRKINSSTKVRYRNEILQQKLYFKSEKIRLSPPFNRKSFTFFRQCFFETCKHSEV